MSKGDDEGKPKGPSAAYLREVADALKAKEKAAEGEFSIDIPTSPGKSAAVIAAESIDRIARPSGAVALAIDMQKHLRDNSLAAQIDKSVLASIGRPTNLALLREVADRATV